MKELLEEAIYMDEDTQKDKYLAFYIEGVVYCIEISVVTEIIGIQPITMVPEYPDYVKGIINVRGRIFPVMDLRLRFNKLEREYDDRTCVVVVELNNMMVGLIVDTVAEVCDIPEGNISFPPNMQENDNNKYLRGIGKKDEKVMLILDCKKILED